MTQKGAIKGLIAARIRAILGALELILPDVQFRRIRKLILDQLGESGLERDLARLLGNGRS
jgi:hypothetical protein